MPQSSFLVPQINFSLRGFVEHVRLKLRAKIVSRSLIGRLRSDRPISGGVTTRLPADVSTITTKLSFSSFRKRLKRRQELFLRRF